MKAEFSVQGNDSGEKKDWVREFLQISLYPVLRFCVRRGVKLQQLLELIKLVFIQVANDELKRDGEKVNTSRIFVLTGVHRKDIPRLLKEPRPKKTAQDLVRRVIGQWRHDPAFSSSPNKPRVLGVEGDTSDFFKLVTKVSSDVNPYTIRFEMERLGLIQRTPRGVKLVSSFRDLNKSSLKELYGVLGMDLNDLFLAVEENVFETTDIKHLHLRTEYDSIQKSALSEIKNWLLDEGSRFHRRARDFLSQFDSDLNPKVKEEEEKMRISVGTFSFAEKSEHQSSEKLPAGRKKTAGKKKKA